MPRVNKQVLGIIYPIPQRFISRFFDSGKTVFVKFVGRFPIFLTPRLKLFFYQSGGGKNIVGEARICELLETTPDEIQKRFGDKLFLTPDEFTEYIGDRRLRQILALVLSDVKKYRTPLKLEKKVTMAGCYMTREMYNGMRSRFSLRS